MGTFRLLVEVWLRWADEFRKHMPADMENPYLEPACWNEASTNTYHTPLVKDLFPTTMLGSFPD